MRKMKGGMILLKVNKIFRIRLLQTENTYLPSRIKVALKSDISSQHKINVGPLRVINTNIMSLTLDQLPSAFSVEVSSLWKSL